jgi:ribosome-associated protein
VRPAARRPTRPPAAAKRKRLDAKSRRGEIKTRRAKPDADD